MKPELKAVRRALKEALEQHSAAIVTGDLARSPTSDDTLTALAEAALATLRQPASVEAEPVDIVFDGPPSPKGCRFIEVEDAQGKSVRLGKWVDRGDGTWALRIDTELARTALAADTGEG